MKKWIGLAALLALAVGCSSSPKKDEAPANAKPAATAAKEADKTPGKDEKKDSGKTTKTSESAGKDVACKSGSDERTIAIQGDGSKCEVIYTKAGQSNSVASSSSGMSHCDEVAARIRGKLEGAGFKCE